MHLKNDVPDHGFQRANMPGVEKLMTTMLEEDLEGEKLTLFVEFQEPLDE